MKVLLSIFAVSCVAQHRMSIWPVGTQDSSKDGSRPSTIQQIIPLVLPTQRDLSWRLAWNCNYDAKMIKMISIDAQKQRYTSMTNASSPAYGMPGNVVCTGIVCGCAQSRWLSPSGSG